MTIIIHLNLCFFMLNVLKIFNLFGEYIYIFLLRFITLFMLIIESKLFFILILKNICSLLLNTLNFEYYNLVIMYYLNI
jgi:hypothetical protein